MPRHRSTVWNNGSLAVYITSLVLLFMYISAVTTPPSKHVELVVVDSNSISPSDARAVDGNWHLASNRDSPDNHVEDWLPGSITSQRPLTARQQVDIDGNLSPTLRLWHTWIHAVHNGVDRVGDFLLMGLGLDEDDHDDDDDVTRSGDLVYDNAFSPNENRLATWAESTVYVERTHALFTSRPSSFGPHILHDALAALLYPISVVAPTNASACASNASIPDPHFELPKQGWVALIERGHCSFSAKVKYAQDRGAVAVIFGDQHATEGGIRGIGGLLTPWSPDDTSNIMIPSVFVSRSSYLALLNTWTAEQDPPGPKDDPSKPPSGLLVILSKDELFAWPLLDLLILVLFLPSLLTLLTVFTQRLRIVRQRQRDRAPPSIVASLPVFTWGEPYEHEKKRDELDSEQAAVNTGEDEERSLGVSQSETSGLLPTGPLGTRRQARSNQWLSSRWAAAVRTRAARLVKLGHTRRQRKVQLAPRKTKHLYPGYGATDEAAGNLVECAICLCDFEKGDRVMELPCGHLFHEIEITPWLLDTKRHCPICRASITVEDEDADNDTALATPALSGAAATMPTSLPVTLPVTAVTSLNNENEAVSASAPASLATGPAAASTSSSRHV